MNNTLSQYLIYFIRNILNHLSDMLRSMEYFVSLFNLFYFIRNILNHLSIQYSIFVIYFAIKTLF
jgi:hypothetical protein